MKRNLALTTILWLLMVINPASSAQVTFTDVTTEAGLGNVVGNAGGTWGDYDNDGDVDLFLFRGSNGKELYRNEGDGRFMDVTQTVGIMETTNGGFSGCSTAIFGDFDNDGDLDLFTGGGSSVFGDVLYRNNGDGTFENVSKAAGMDSEVRLYFGALSFDYDTDGFLDIYIANFSYGSFPNLLYHNEGNLRFKEIAAQVGLDEPKSSDGIGLGDYDNDGDLDIFVTTSTLTPPQSTDVFYRNEGNEVFTDVTQKAGLWREGFDKNAFFWDYDNDGHLDLFIHSWPTYAAGKTSVLYRNNGDGTFTDVTKTVGIEPIEVDSSGAYYGDYDNDGWLDLCITYHNSPTRLYHNNGDGTFTEVSNEAGIDGTNSGTVSFVDYDNDGDLDIFTGQSPIGGADLMIKLYRNNSTPNRWLQLKLVGTQSNRDAIGTRVKVTLGGLSMLREVTGCSGGYYGNKQDRLPVHIGLGQNSQADVIEIRWPSGTVDVLRDVPADQLVEVKEGSGLQVTAVQSRGKLPITLGQIKPHRKLPIKLGQIKQTALLQNYPNPFNPETWIPFVLNETAEVEIRIYDVSGVLVRTLRPGQKAKGEYRSKDKAAYWDGKNDAGEALGSDIYFYEMRTGDYTSVRKAMLRK